MTTNLTMNNTFGSNESLTQNQFVTIDSKEHP